MHWSWLAFRVDQVKCRARACIESAPAVSVIMYLAQHRWVLSTGRAMSLFAAAVRRVSWSRLGRVERRCAPSRILFGGHKECFMSGCPETYIDWIRLVNLLQPLPARASCAESSVREASGRGWWAKAMMPPPVSNMGVPLILLTCYVEVVPSLYSTCPPRLIER